MFLCHMKTYFACTSLSLVEAYVCPSCNKLSCLVLSCLGIVWQHFRSNTSKNWICNKPAYMYFKHSIQLSLNFIKLGLFNLYLFSKDQKNQYFTKKNSFPFRRCLSLFHIINIVELLIIKCCETLQNFFLL